MRKRFLALVLAVCLVVGIMPPMADAVGDETMYKEPAVTSLTVSYIDEDGSAKTASLLPVGSAQAGLRAQPGSKMQFTVKFDTSERLAQVYITSTRDGDTQYLKANYDHQEDAYIADGYFDSSDSNYIPGTIGVSYSKKIVNVTSEDTILRSIDLAGWTNQLADLGITVTRSEVQGDAIASEVLLSMESTARKVALETAIKEFVDKEDMDQWLKVYTGLGEVDFDTKKGYDLFSSDAKENYSLYLDYGVNEFLTIVKDISGNKYTAMIFKKLDDTYDLEDLANTMSGLNSVASAFYDYNAITTEMNELRKDVSNNTSMDAEQKKEANDKIDELENDKKWFMMGTTFLPLIVSATVLTGGAAIPAAPALIFSAYLSAITATSDYFWDHRIGLIQGCEPVKNAFAVDNEHGGGWTPITNEWLEEEPNRAINESGKYYIAEDVQYGDNLFRNVIASLYPYDGTKHIDVTICLHGHKVGGISSGEGCNTTLLDCKYHRAADGSVSGGAITGFLANISNNGKLRVLNCILENGHMSNTLSSNDPEGGMLTFEGGTLKGACSISNGIGGIMTISGGEIVKDTANQDFVYNNGTLNILDGTILEPSNLQEGTYQNVGITNNESGIIKITGGKLAGTTPDGLFTETNLENRGKIEVKGGELGPINNLETGTLSIYGGTIYNHNSTWVGAGSIVNTGVAEIFGGDFVSNNCGITNKKSGKVTIRNGTVVSTLADGGDFQKRGIYNDGTVYFNGGVLTGFHTGISNTGSLFVSGGQIHAKTEGISNGDTYSKTGNAVINSGTIQAQYALTNDYGDVTINDGTVLGSGGGLSIDNYGGIIYINGGVVGLEPNWDNPDADWCSGIRNSPNSDGNVYITNGTIQGDSCITQGTVTALIDPDSSIEFNGGVCNYSSSEKAKLIVANAEGYNGGIAYTNTKNSISEMRSLEELNSIDYTQEYYAKFEGESAAGTKKEIASIKIKSNPTKLDYVFTDKFQPTGLTITVTYSDGSSEDIALNENNATYSDLDTVGENQIVYITYGGKTISLSGIKVAQKVITANNDNIVLEYKETEYDGIEKKPSVTIKDGNNVIPVGEYSVEYSNNVNKGTATVTITDKAGGNYSVSGSTTFRISGKLLTGAKVEILGTYTYNGNAHTPSVTVTKNGATISKSEYDISYTNPNGTVSSLTNAGTVTVTVTGKGDYEGAATAVFEIMPAKLTVTGVTAESRKYDGSKNVAVSAVDLDGAIGGDDVKIGTANLIGTVSEADVGTYTSVTLPTLSLAGAAAGNYILQQPTGGVPVSVSISQASAPTANSGELPVSINLKRTYSYDLGRLLPVLSDGKTFGDVTYKLGAATITDGYYSTGANIANNKLVLPIEAAEGTPKDIGTITVTISSTNFEDITATIMVKSVDKIVPAGEPVLSVATITYGQSVSTIMMSGTLDDGAGEKVPGTFTWDKPDAVPNAGSYSAKWTFTPDNPALYTSATGSATITVNPASLAGAVITLDFTSYAFDNIPKTPTIVNVALGEVILTDTDYTANIPSGTAAGTYTITVTGKGNYTGTAITTYRINPVSTALVRPQELPEDTDTNKSKVEIEGGISTVPAVIIGSRPELNTPAKLETAMRTEVTQVDTGIAQENTAIYDVKLKVSTDSGNTWQEAKKENFPADGRLTVTLPYPTGTDSTYIFTVVHMFTTSDFGKTPGDTEILPVTNTADGIKFTVTGLSPISVGWVKKSNDNTGGHGGSGGGWFPSVSYYTVKLDETEYGSVAAKPTSIYAGGTVTLTVMPDKGYKLDKLTVIDSQGKVMEVTEKSGKYTFKMPSRNVTVTAEFVPEQVSTPTPMPEATPTPSTTPTPDVTPTSQPWKNPFPDVSDTAWYIKAIEYVAVEGLMHGYPNSKFGPNDNISRAEFAQIIYNKAGRPDSGSSVFTDVKAGEWYTNAVTWAAEQKVVSGIGNNQFAPKRDITREELATMLWRYAGSPDPVMTTLSFTDASIVSNFAKKAMLWANENGIVNGKGNGILDPKGKATRAETAQMLMNYLKK